MNGTSRTEFIPVLSKKRLTVGLLAIGIKNQGTYRNLDVEHRHPTYEFVRRMVQFC